MILKTVIEISTVIVFNEINEDNGSTNLAQEMIVSNL